MTPKQYWSVGDVGTDSDTDITHIAHISLSEVQRYTPHRAGVAYLILSCRVTPHIEQGWPTLSSSNGYTSHRVGVAHFLGFSIADNDYCCHTACHSTTSTFP